MAASSTLRHSARATTRASTRSGPPGDEMNCGAAATWSTDSTITSGMILTTSIHRDRASPMLHLEHRDGGEIREVHERGDLDEVEAAARVVGGLHAGDAPDGDAGRQQRLQA